MQRAGCRPTEYNPPLDSDNPDDPTNDFTFSEAGCATRWATGCGTTRTRTASRTANEPGYNGADGGPVRQRHLLRDAVGHDDDDGGPAGFGDGYYQFTDLPAGDYCLQFGNLPAGWSISPANQGGNDAHGLRRQREWRRFPTSA